VNLVGALVTYCTAKRHPLNHILNMGRIINNY